MELDSVLTQVKLMIDRTIGHTADFRIDGTLFRGTVLRSEIDLTRRTVMVWVTAPGQGAGWPYIKVDYDSFETVYHSDARF